MYKSTYFSNKVVAITGGARGIGLATAKAFAAQGAKVSIGDVDSELAADEANQFAGLGMALDVRDPESFRVFIANTTEAFGPVDVLINNAGIMPMGHFLEEVGSLTDAQIDINLRGVIHGCRTVLPDMLVRGQGHVVNVASVAGVMPVPGLSVYCATKFAVVGLTQSLREEYRDSGVAFTTILPAKVETDLASGTDNADRGVPSATAERVAQSIVTAVKRRKAELSLPWFLRLAAGLMSLSPRWFQTGFRRLYKDHRLLQKVDAEERAGYDDRLRKLSEDSAKQ